MTDYNELRSVEPTGQIFNYGSSTELVDFIENILFRRVVVLSLSITAGLALAGSVLLVQMKTIPFERHSFKRETGIGPKSARWNGTQILFCT